MWLNRNTMYLWQNFKYVTMRIESIIPDFLLWKHQKYQKTGHRETSIKPWKETDEQLKAST